MTPNTEGGTEVGQLRALLAMSRELMQAERAAARARAGQPMADFA